MQSTIALVIGQLCSMNFGEIQHTHLAKSAMTPLHANLWLSWKDLPTGLVPYAPIVGPLMYAIFATQPNLAHVVDIISTILP